MPEGKDHVNNGNCDQYMVHSLNFMQNISELIVFFLTNAVITGDKLMCWY